MGDDYTKLRNHLRPKFLDYLKAKRIPFYPPLSVFAPAVANNAALFWMNNGFVPTVERVETL